MKLYSRRQGQGAPLLLYHGLFGSGDNLAPIAKLLEADFDVISPDLRNHGRSPHDKDMTFEAMAADLLELLNDLNLPKAHLLGHSLGGKAVMRLALDHPARVSKLLVADITPKAYGPLYPQVFDALETLDLKELSSRTEAEARLLVKIPDAPTRGLLLKNLGKNEADQFYWKMNLEALSKAKQNLGEEITALIPFSGPTCFLRGELSPYVQDNDLPAIKKLFPSASLATLAGAGHWLHAEQPSQFAEAVKKFLNATD